MIAGKSVLVLNSRKDPLGMSIRGPQPLGKGPAPAAGDVPRNLINIKEVPEQESRTHIGDPQALP